MLYHILNSGTTIKFIAKSAHKITKSVILSLYLYAGFNDLFYSVTLVKEET